MTKQKISVTIDKEMISLVESLLESGEFRNRSHVMEFALGKLMEDGK
jgi:Arc/MetJ-type ribon-helix-helix transcriptional regulator